MPDTKLEELLEIVKNGSTFESLRAAKSVAELKRSQKVVEEDRRRVDDEPVRPEDAGV
jgi:hypothetical protein